MQNQLPLNDPQTYIPPLDRQVAGNHYKDFAIQPVEFCELNGLPCCMCNIIKYVMRHRAKHGKEDLQKASHYCELGMSIFENNRTIMEAFVESTNIRMPVTWEIEPKEFIEANRLTGREAKVILHLASVFDRKGVLGYLEAKKEIDLLLKEDHR